MVAFQKKKLSSVSNVYGLRLAIAYIDLPSDINHIVTFNVQSYSLNIQCWILFYFNFTRWMAQYRVMTEIQRYSISHCNFTNDKWPSFI